MISVSEQIQFYSSDEQNQQCPITIRNISNSVIAFKIRTTSPTQFLVVPSNGVLGPREESTSTITMIYSEEILSKSHKFRIQAVLSVEDDPLRNDWEFGEVEIHKRTVEFIHKETKELSTETFKTIQDRKNRNSKLEEELDSLRNANEHQEQSNQQIRTMIQHAESRINFISKFDDIMNSEVGEGYGYFPIGFAFTIGLFFGYILYFLNF